MAPLRVWIIREESWAGNWSWFGLLVGLPLRLPLELGDEDEEEPLTEDVPDEPTEDEEVRDREGTELDVALLDPIRTSPPVLVAGLDPGLRCDVLTLPLLLL